jgi:hypothetical protein
VTNDFPEKGGFIPPHIARKKPDCDKKPLIPDPCELRNSKTRNFFKTDAECLNDEPKIVCPADLVITRRHKRIVKIPVVKIPPPLPDPTPTPDGFNDPDLFGNSQLVISCPEGPDDLSLFSCNDIDIPDPEGQYPTHGRTITILNDTFFAQTKEDADELAITEAKELACTSLNCQWGNPEISGECIDLLTNEDIAFLVGLGLSNSDLVKGEGVTIPANSFLSEISLADATSQAEAYLQERLLEVCYLCNPRLEKPCEIGEEPAEGYTMERCAFQGRFNETNIEELTAKAQEYLDNFECFALPVFNDEFCRTFDASINIENPNLKNDCGDGEAKYEKGQKSGEVVANDDDDCGFVATIKLPKIPCPCGYDVSVIVDNPNTAADCGLGDAKYEKGQESGEAALPREDSSCENVVELKLPKIPCPCGYNTSVIIDNPNTQQDCGVGDAAYKQGQPSGEAAKDDPANPDCNQLVEIALPQIPCPCGYKTTMRVSRCDPAGGPDIVDVVGNGNPADPCTIDMGQINIPCPPLIQEINQEIQNFFNTPVFNNIINNHIDSHVVSMVMGNDSPCIPSSVVLMIDNPNNTGTQEGPEEVVILGPTEAQGGASFYLEDAVQSHTIDVTDRERLTFTLSPDTSVYDTMPEIRVWATRASDGEEEQYAWLYTAEFPSESHTSGLNKEYTSLRFEYDDVEASYTILTLKYRLEEKPDDCDLMASLEFPDVCSEIGLFNDNDAFVAIKRGKKTVSKLKLIKETFAPTDNDEPRCFFGLQGNDFEIPGDIDVSNDSVKIMRGGKVLSKLVLKKEYATNDELNSIISLVGNDFDLGNDTVVGVTNDEVELRDYRGGESYGKFGLEKQDNGKIRLSPENIDLPGCVLPDDSAYSVDFTVGSQTIGTISLAEGENDPNLDCRLKLIGGPIEIPIGNDFDISCTKPDESDYSITFIQGSSTIGTAILEEGGDSSDCRLKLTTGSGSDINVFEGWSERTIDVCTPSGIEQFTIIVKD